MAEFSKGSDSRSLFNVSSLLIPQAAQAPIEYILMIDFPNDFTI